MGAAKLTPARFAPAEAGARAHLHDASRRSGRIASVLPQVCSMHAGLLATVIGRTPIAFVLSSDQRERFFTNRAASAKRQLGLRGAYADYEGYPSFDYRYLHVLLILFPNVPLDRVAYSVKTDRLTGAFRLVFCG